MSSKPKSSQSSVVSRPPSGSAVRRLPSASGPSSVVSRPPSGSAGPSSAVRPPSSGSAVSAERVTAFIRSRFNPIRTLTPQLLAQYLDEFKTGYLRSCALTFDAIEDRDDTIKTVAAKRKKAAARNGWEILLLDSVQDDQADDAELHKHALQYFYNNISVTNAIDANERGEVSLLVRHMLDAVGKRYAVHEIIWQPDDGRQTTDGGPAFAGGLTAEFRFVPLWFFENRTGALRFLPSEGTLDGIPLEENGWLITVSDGLMAACSIAYIYKTMSLRDWVIYNERHGMPGIHGKTDAAKDSPEWDDLVKAVQNFAADWALVTNSGATIEPVEMATKGQLPYPPLVERMDRALAALWRGADLSTISAGAGQGQGASIQGDETNILEADDAQLISETLNRQVDRFVIEYTFGAGIKPLAYFKLKTSQKKNIDQEIKVDGFLRDSGAPLGVKNVLERYNRTMPAADEQLLLRGASSVERIASDPNAQPSGDTARPGVQTRDPSAPPGSAGPLLNQRVRGQRSEISNQDPSSVVRPPSSVADAVAATIGVRSEWLTPFFAALESKAADGNLTDAELLAAIEAMAQSLPELMTETSVQDTAAIVQKTLTSSVVAALAERGPGKTL